MRKIFPVTMVLSLVLAGIPSICSGPSEQRISKRIAKLRQRIDEGTRAGTLTPAEKSIASILADG